MPDSRSSLRLIAEIGLALAAFLFVATWLGRAAGVPEVGDFSTKLRWLDHHAEAVDVVFVGSSRIRRGVVPAAFDAAAAVHGIGIRSFNLGIAGMEPAEADTLVRHLARRFAGRDDHPRWLIIEVADWDAELETENRFKGRAIFWHDTAATRTALRALDTVDADPEHDGAWIDAERFDLRASHVLHWAARASGAGRGPDLLRRLVGAPPRPPADAFPTAGYDRYSDASYTTHPMRRTFLAHVDGYRQWLEPRLAVAPGVAVDATSTAPTWVADAWARQVATLRAVGIEPIYVLPPTPRPATGGRRLATDGVLPTLLAFDDPVVHPELFAVEHRFDLEHLTHDGAVAFSRHLGAAFAEHVAGSTNSPSTAILAAHPTPSSSAR